MNSEEHKAAEALVNKAVEITDNMVKTLEEGIANKEAEIDSQIVELKEEKRQADSVADEMQHRWDLNVKGNQASSDQGDPGGGLKAGNGYNLDRYERKRDKNRKKAKKAQRKIDSLENLKQK